MMKLTVVIPVYNGEKTIKRCLDSVLSQTLKDIEIIVVNDGSTDCTEKIVKSYDEYPVKLINIENCGQGLARNIGIGEAAGKYIGFVDADDTICPDMYETMYNFAKKNNADIVQCAINDIRESEATIRPVTEDEFVVITAPEDYTNRYFCTSKHTNEVCNKIFSKRFLEDTGLLFSDTRRFFSEDLKFNIDLLAHIKNIGFVKKPLYNYYISDGGHCRSKTPLRVKKIFDLYIDTTEKITNRRVRNAIRSMAVVNVMSYAVPVIEDVKNIICSKTIKKFMISSCFHKKKLRHTALMLLLIILPYPLKKKPIVKYYTF